MNALIQAWLDAETKAQEARAAADLALADAEENAALPTNLRPATPRDIVENPPGWKMVEAVHYPDDPWKAYCSHDGCRYGLEGAFVESQ